MKKTIRPDLSERLAEAALLVSGAVMLFAIAVLFTGVVQKGNEPLTAAILSDRMALLWITVTSVAHLIFVPAFCVKVALRDDRLQKQGVPVPGPASVWKAHARVFEKDDEVRQPG